MTTDTLTRDPNDSGEIAAPETVAALTENTAVLERIVPPYTDSASPLRLYCTSEQPLYAPTQPRPSVPLPPVPAPPRPSHAGHLPIVIDVDDRQAHAELGEYKLRRSVPYVLPAERPGWTVARHRRPSRLSAMSRRDHWTLVAVVGGLVAAGVIGAVLYTYAALTLGVTW